MSNLRLRLTGFGVFVLFLLGLLGLTAINFRIVTRQNCCSSFKVYWTSIRSFIIDGDNPYSEKTSVRIQSAFEENPITPGLFVIDQSPPKVKYPLFSLLFLVLFALISNYTWALSLWLTFFEVSLIILVIICLRLTNRQIDLFNAVLYGVFSLTWFHSATSLIKGDLIVLASVFLAGSLLAIKNEKDEIAGFLLCLSLIKPEAVLLVVVYSIVWALVERRMRLIAWFFGSLALMVFGWMFFLPDWPLEYLRIWLNNPDLSTTSSILRAFSSWWPGIGAKFGLAFSIVAAIFLLLECWRALRNHSFRSFLWACCLIITLGTWVGVPTSPINLLALNLPVAFILGQWIEGWNLAGRILSLLGIIILDIGIWIYYFFFFQSWTEPSASAIFLLIAPFLVLLGLYWIRWSAFRPHWLLFEERHG